MYLNKTRGIGLRFKPVPSRWSKGYCDADFHGSVPQGAFHWSIGPSIAKSPRDRLYSTHGNQETLFSCDKRTRKVTGWVNVIIEYASGIQDWNPDTALQHILGIYKSNRYPSPVAFPLLVCPKEVFATGKQYLVLLVRQSTTAPAA